MNAVDTNILIYLHDQRDEPKQEIAGSLVESLTDGVLLWQVACEFVAASRKLTPFGFTSEQAWRELRRLRSLWTTKLPSWAITERAEEMTSRYALSFWDSLLIAACLEGGVTRLYSEDLDNSAAATGLEIVNPFAG